MTELKGKVALITGASSGIGRATALLLAKRGAKVIVNYHSNKEKAETTAHEIYQTGGESFVIQADVTKIDHIKDMVEKSVSVFGSINILVNNAGSGIKPATIMEMTEALWDETYAINVKSILFCTQATLK